MGYFFAERKDGKTEIQLSHSVSTFPWSNVSRETLAERKRQCFADFGTFDIESTTINDPERPYGFMYHWQACISGHCVYARTWEDFKRFLTDLINTLHPSEECPYIIFIHNLSFEFQWIRQLLDEETFGEMEVFAPQRRKPLTVRLSCGLEFRCSYKLTNMSLYKFTTTEYGNNYIKSDGDLDYSITRYPDTPLTDLEYSYCMNDVFALYHAIHAKLRNDGDTLLTLPLTSTAYVRRDCRKRCRADKNYRKIFTRNVMSPAVYTLLKEAGRGGDTGANRYLAGAVISDVDSFDVTSSYPYQLLTQKFPTSRFYLYSDSVTLEELDTLCEEKAVLFRVGFGNIRIKPDSVDAYLPTSKALSLLEYRQANGRLLRAKEAIYTITEIDWVIIKDLYEWDTLYLGEVYTAKKDYLPQPIRDTVYDYFKKKCELAILRDQYDENTEQYAYYNYLYAKMKNKLNGIFGMCYTDPVRDVNTIDKEGNWSTEKADVKEALEEFYDSYNSFLVYAWGVWTTAHARNHLQKLLHLTGEQTIYWDTDSSKAHITPDILTSIHEANRTIQKLCISHGAYYEHGNPSDADYKIFYLGVYEHETSKGSYKEFKTLGAKKYAYTDAKNNLHCTISGVAKSSSPSHPDGARELKTLSNFKIGFIFKEAGGKTLYYNQQPFHTTTINGHTVEIGDNIAMVDSTYKIGITREYAEVLGYSVIDGEIYEDSVD